MAVGLSTLLTVTVLTYVCTSSAQSAFPEVLDVSRDQPVTTEPSSAVCGLSTVSSFCRSTTSPSSVTQCLLASCTSQCPTRTATPAYVDLFVSVRSGSCVVLDYVNVRPRSPRRAYSVLFLRSVAETDPSTCYVRPPVNPVIGSDGSFTVTFWIWLNSNNTGFVQSFSVLWEQLYSAGCGRRVTLSVIALTSTKGIIELEGSARNSCNSWLLYAR